MNVEHMRSMISDVYPGDKWKNRVAAMWDDQVIAIFHNFTKRGMFEKPKGNRKVKQLTIFDLLEKEEKKTIDKELERKSN